MEQLTSIAEKTAQFVISIFKYHKLKLASVIAFALLFAVLIFPYGDLSMLITNSVAQRSKNQVYLQMEDVGLDLFPSPGLALKQAILNTPELPTIQIDSLTVAPSIPAFLSLRPGANVNAEGVLGGYIKAQVVQGEATAAGNENFMNVNIEAQGIDLGQLIDLAILPVPLAATGATSLTSGFQFVQSMVDQPEGEYSLLINQMAIKPTTLDTQLGPVNLPEMKFEQVLASGRLVGQKFIIEEGKLGETKDPFHGRFRGQIQVKFENISGRIMPRFGPYEFRIELNTTSSFQLETKNTGLALIYTLLDDFKSRTVQGGSRYLFKIAAPSFRANPKPESIATFQ